MSEVPKYTTALTEESWNEFLKGDWMEDYYRPRKPMPFILTNDPRTDIKHPELFGKPVKCCQRDSVSSPYPRKWLKEPIHHADFTVIGVPYCVRHKDYVFSLSGMHGRIYALTDAGIEYLNSQFKWFTEE